MGKFPSNPSDGMIFEASAGCFYIYCKADNSWNRLPGVDQLGIATEQENGLLSKDDFKKLSELLIPPPQTSIKGEQCEFTYKSGQMALYNTDEFINIKDTLSTQSGNSQFENSWDLHQNTHGIDFTVNTDKLFAELDILGNIKRTIIEGKKGPKGDKGDPGIDKLNTGPVGPDGEPGQNLPFAGTITPESVQFERIEPNSNRAIVDITTEEISPDENYLVVKRANIGSSEASPSKVVPINLETDWIAVVDVEPSASQKVIESASCTQKIVCRSTTSSVYYLNAQSILSAFEERFEQLLDRLKIEKEFVASEYLKTMVNMFTSQKSAICCALENCRSRKRNTIDRRYIEEQRTQAAQAGFNIKLDPKSRETLDLNIEKNCTVSATPGESSVTFGDFNDCNDCAARVVIDGRVSTGKEDNAVVFDMPPGEYIVTIEECCINESLIKSRWNGQVIIKYKREALQTGGGPIKDATITFPECGTYEEAVDAEDAYIGLTVQISHSGGQIKMWAPDKYPDDNEGKIEVCFKRQECFQTSFGTEEEETDDTIFVYRDSLGEDNLIGAILPFVGDDSAIDNYGLGTGSDIEGPNIALGCRPEVNQTNLFFYDGSDGLSFFTTNGALGIGNNIVNYDYEIINNNVDMQVVVSDDAGELGEVSPNKFTGSWVQNGNGDGGVIGYFDRRDDAPWIMDFVPNNPGSIDILKICSRDGQHLFVPAPPGIVPGVGFSVLGNMGFSKRIELTSFEANDGIKLMVNGAVSFGLPRRNQGSTFYSNRLTRSPDGRFINDGQNISSSTLAGIIGINAAIIAHGINRKLRGQGNTFGLMFRIEYDDGDVEEFIPYTATRFGGGWSHIQRFEVRTGYERSIGTIIENDQILTQRHMATFQNSPICDDAAYSNASGSGGWATSSATHFAGKPNADRYCNRFVVSYVRFKKPGKLFAFVNGGDTALQQSFIGQYDIMFDKCPAKNFDENLNPVPNFSRFGNDLDFSPVTPFCEGNSGQNEVQKLIFTKIRDGCLMPWQKIEWYERGWRTGACCGAYVELNGQKWLVVKRSIGVDTTCGGGESASEECIRTFVNRWGHPAIAWPSIDGDEFFARPSSGSTTFIFDQDLSNDMIAKLASNDVLDSKGDLANIPIVLFPRLD